MKHGQRRVSAVPAGDDEVDVRRGGFDAVLDREREGGRERVVERVGRECTGGRNGLTERSEIRDVR